MKLLRGPRRVYKTFFHVRAPSPRNDKLDLQYFIKWRIDLPSDKKATLIFMVFSGCLLILSFSLKTQQKNNKNDITMSLKVQFENEK